MNEEQKLLAQQLLEENKSVSEIAKTFKFIKQQYIVCKIDKEFEYALKDIKFFQHQGRQTENTNWMSFPNRTLYLFLSYHAV